MFEGVMVTNSGSGTSIDPPAPVDIRIGWIRLEESAQ